ncbi:hypothetical protein [Mycobacterium sp.]|uniref:hypothetical protein n=1 Tax=Mycobacterium sp. TaxID=1785 RepID=UPI00121A3CB8|nr:hypothetical protein [Mycobacterium sp.]TAM65773.1 MAG: hypothetical protein EPN51_18685 [Mycobacterium sp.]
MAVYGDVTTISEPAAVARERDLRTRIQVGAAWCGVLFIVAFFTGWGLVAGFIPVPTPIKPRDDVVAYFQDNQYRIITGCIITMGGVMFLAPFTAVLVSQMRRIEGSSRILSNTQLFGGAVTAAVATVSCLIFLVAAFRPQRDPEVTLMLSDFGFTSFIGPFAPGFAQCLVMALAIFSDRHATPVYPRWVGYANLWCAVLFLPGPVLFYFLSGPFAWNGVAAFWIPANAFGAWFFIMVYATIKAVRTERQTQRDRYSGEATEGHTQTYLDYV